MGDLPISIPADRLAELCRRNGIARLSLFGSVLRDDFTPRSDVDVLVEFLPGRRVGFFALTDIEDELSAMLDRRVDLNTPASLSKYFRDEVLREARSLYVAA
jgi:predicted nucleotidyltransferase